MSKNAHTPGPWKWDEDFYGLYSENGREPVLQWEPYEGMRLEFHKEGKRDANGHLLAAAPDLLEALQELFDDYKQLTDSGDAGNWGVENTDAGKKAIAALAKARGESC